jgi:hypothetical protein
MNVYFAYRGEDGRVAVKEDPPGVDCFIVHGANNAQRAINLSKKGMNPVSVAHLFCGNCGGFVEELGVCHCILGYRRQEIN